MTAQAAQALCRVASPQFYGKCRGMIWPGRRHACAENGEHSTHRCGSCDTTWLPSPAVGQWRRSRTQGGSSD